jgi:hypothetical protein
MSSFCTVFEKVENDRYLITSLRQLSATVKLVTEIWQKKLWEKLVKKYLRQVSAAFLKSQYVTEIEQNIHAKVLPRFWRLETTEIEWNISCLVSAAFLKN